MILRGFKLVSVPVRAPRTLLLTVCGAELELGKRPYSVSKATIAVAICMTSFLACAFFAASRAPCTAGKSKLIRTPMMAITTSSSIMVKPRGDFRAGIALESWDRIFTGASIFLQQHPALREKET